MRGEYDGSSPAQNRMALWRMHLGLGLTALSIPSVRVAHATFLDRLLSMSGDPQAMRPRPR